MTQLIPVIDLLKGQAVLARHGDRRSYAPLATPLCPVSEPAEVIKAFLNLYPFDTFYIADLDRIMGIGDNFETLHRLLNLYPQCMFWIDAGFPSIAWPSNGIPVIGSESLKSVDLEKLPSQADEWILSLDFKKDDFLGPPLLANNPYYWPSRVIVMSLAQVGGMAGPDWKRLEEFGRRFPEYCWIAAGGLQHKEDLNRLMEIGIHQTLVASALHYGKITPGD